MKVDKVDDIKKRVSQHGDLAEHGVRRHHDGDRPVQLYGEALAHANFATMIPRLQNAIIRQYV